MKKHALVMLIASTATFLSAQVRADEANFQCPKVDDLRIENGMFTGVDKVTGVTFFGWRPTVDGTEIELKHIKEFYMVRIYPGLSKTRTSPENHYMDCHYATYSNYNVTIQANDQKMVIAKTCEVKNKKPHHDSHETMSRYFCNSVEECTVTCEIGKEDIKN